MITFTEEQVSKMKPVKNVKMIRRKTRHSERIWPPQGVMKLEEVNLDGVR